MRTLKLFFVCGLTVLTACAPEDVTPDLNEFDEASRRTLERTREAVELAGDFDQRTALDSMSESPYDVRSIRFVEQLEQAVFAPLEAVSGDTSPDASIMEWSYEQNRGRLVGSGGSLPLEFVPTLPETIGALRLRALAREGENVRLRAELSGGQAAGVIAIRLDLAADGLEHEYTVDIRAALDRRAGEPVDRLVVKWEKGSEARVDSIELLTRTWKYRDRWGAGSERIGAETRPVVYLVGPGSLAWDLKGSWSGARLHFALAQVETGQTNTVRLTLDGGESPSPLAEFELNGGEGWSSHEIDLTEFDLEGARLTLSVDEIGDASEKSGVVLWGAPVLWEPPARRFNVLVLLEDALRADRMSIYGHDQSTTPFKESFFADGVRFERCIAQATKTRFSCPSIMTSLRPFATGVWGIWNRNIKLDSGYLTLAEILASRGWATASFLQNGNAGPDNGLDQGFERVVENLPGRADGVYGGEALDWIRSVSERNFFGYLHVADPHAPYDPPAPRRLWHDAIMIDSGGPKWSDEVWLTGVRRALYDGEVANNDDALPPLIDELTRLGLLEDTLIVLIADHGEHLGEHGLWEHIPPSYFQVAHVPMLMRYPSRLAGERVIPQPVQNLDLMPTILDLAGIDTSLLPLQGRSLLPLVDSPDSDEPLDLAVVQEVMLYSHPDDPRLHGSLVWDGWHYIRSRRVGQVLFDHVRDPEENQPFSPSEEFSRRAWELLFEMRKLDEELHGHLRGDATEEVEVDLDTIHNLEALGYLDE